MNNINYLSEIKLADFSVSLNTEEFNVWQKECTQFFQYIINVLKDTKCVSRSTVCKNIKNSCKQLGEMFKKITDKKLSVTKNGSTNIQEYLKNVYGRSTFYKKYDFKDDIFETLLKLEYSIIISKNKTVYAGQLPLIGFKLLFDYFKVYDKDIYNNYYWTITFNQVNNIINNVLAETVNELLNNKEVKKIKKELELEQSIKAAYNNRMIAFEPEIKYLGKKPFNAQCLRDLWKGVSDEEITQPEKLELIMEKYDCSLSTATRYMKKFGLWVSRNEKKSDSSETEKLKTENIALKNRIKELEEENRQLKQCKSISVQSDIDENDIPDSSAGKINILNNNIGFNHITADTEGLDPDMLDDDDILVKYQ